MNNGEEPEPIDLRDLAAVLTGPAQARRREFASNAEIGAALRRLDIPPRAL
jgi:hypothetical protein